MHLHPRRPQRDPRDFFSSPLDLTLVLESAGYEHGTDLSNESNARVRVRRGAEEETLEMVRRHPSEPTATPVLGREIVLEVVIATGGRPQAILWVR